MLEGGDDLAAESRVTAHLGRCADCRQTRDRLLALRSDVSRAAAPLDDMRRARVLGRLAAALDDQAADGGARRRAGVGRRPWARWLLAPVIGSAALAALWLWRSAGPPPPASPTAVASKPAVVAPAAPASTNLAVLQPYQPPAPRAAAPVPPVRPVDRLELPAGSKLRLHLGSRATATLIGPARMQVISNDGTTLEVNLAQGTLVADYDHRAGGQLLVRSPGAIARVIGTLFSVKAGATGSRIVVARGRVAVTGAQGPVRTLAAGDALTTDTAATRRWTRDDRRPLEEHARAVTERVTPVSQRHHATAQLQSPEPAPAVLAETPAAPGASPLPVPVAPPPVPQPAPAAKAPIVAPPAPSAPPAHVPPAAVTPAPAAVVPAPAVPTAESLYQRAEQAMRRRDWNTARQQLADVVALGTGHPLEDVARYELAQLALRAGDAPRAVALLDELLRSDREPALAQPARLLRCELHLQAGEQPQARRCLERFRAAYPQSPHDEAALGLLVESFVLDPSCAGVAELADEYLQRYPSGSRANQARRHRTRCSP